MIASLMMYARPELDAEHARFWGLIRAELAARGVDAPKALSNDADAFTLWRDPALVLSQTCGMPYRTRLHGAVSLIGTPDYGLEGCAPGYYRSPLVVRADDPRVALRDFAQARLAYNAPHSQSGFASIYAAAKAQGFWFEDKVQSGGHAASAQMVANGKADIAALDAVTWGLIQRYDGYAHDLRVLDWTTPTPGLPFIAASTADVSATFDAVSAAIDGLSTQDKAALMLKGFVKIPAEAYLAVPNPPEEAR